MANHGLKASQQGVDVLSATQRQLRALSTKTNLKIYRWGETASETLSGDYAIREVTHGLGYAPCVWVFANYSGTYYPIGDTNDVAGIVASTDSSKLYIEAYNSFGKLTILPACKYYIFADKAQEFNSVSNKVVTGDIGMKSSEDEVNVLGANEYELTTSSKFKSLQYYNESIKEETLTLPAMFASYNDINVEESQYVDFNHGLGYPPAFVAWFKTGSIYKEIPYAEYNSVLGSDHITQSYYVKYEVKAFCDSTKIRVTFRRVSNFDYYYFLDNYSSDFDNFSAETITVKVLPFAENLDGLNYGE